jgi:putative ABC transport system permease protein
MNEKAVRSLGFKSATEAVGQEINGNIWGGWQKYRIVGVVEDYHHEAVKTEVYPTVFFLNHSMIQQVYYSIRLSKGSDTHQAISKIEKAWKEVFPQKTFSYFFMDDFYDKQFRSEVRFNRMFSLFAFVAIVIAGLGVLGMTVFESQSRLKEISIRKIHGAPSTNLVLVLIKEHLRMVTASFIISVPLIYFLAMRWLLNYPTRIGLSGFIFLIPLLLLTGMILMVSGFQIFRAIKTNPVKYLRLE